MRKGEVSAINYSSNQQHDNRSFENDGGHVTINMNNKANGSSSANGRSRGRGLDTRKSSLAAAATLSAHDIDYTVRIKDKFYKSAEEKQILHKVTGIFTQGMNAILGPSGCGKSSFLDVLAGRVDENNVKGSLLLDSKRPPKNFKCMVGYVVQDDVIVGTLTVRENLAFSAALRLPKTVTAEEKLQRVDEVISELGLTGCADTKVGTELIRGVSGGERKRCNIGMEMIIRPPVLFLDEPTTGLDANTASTVLIFLKRLSERGRTIIFSIHQPRFAIYRLFDKVMLLAAGHTVFHGPADQALDFFQQQGYVCQEHNNPPDFFLDVINGDPSVLGSEDTDSLLEGGGGNQLDQRGNEPLHTRSVKKKAFHIIANKTVPYTQNFESRRLEGVKSKRDALVAGFKKSTWNQNLQDEANAIHSTFKELHQGKPRDEIQYATTFATQVGVLSQRTVKNIIRNPQIGVATFMTTIFFSLLVSALYYDITDNPISAIHDRKGSLFFIIMNQVMINMAAVEIFIGERRFFLHENVTGFYRVSVYFVVKVFCDILPLRLLPVLLQSSIVYYLIGYEAGAAEFFKFVLTLCSISLPAVGLCFLLSAVFKVFAITQLLMSVIFVVMMLFSGFLVNLRNVADWLSWIQYLSFIKYGMNNLFITELKDANFCVKGNTTSECNGNLHLAAFDIDYDEEWYFWQNIIINFSFAIGYLLLTYLNLRIAKKHR